MSLHEDKPVGDGARKLGFAPGPSTRPTSSSRHVSRVGRCFGSVGLAALLLAAPLLLAVCGLPATASARRVSFSVYPATDLVLTLADPVGGDSDTQDFEIEYSTLEATVRVKDDPVYGTVVSEISFDSGDIGFDHAYFDYDMVIPPFTDAVVLDVRHWFAWLPTAPIAATAVATNTASLDLSGVELGTCCEVVLAYSQGHVFVYPVLAFETEAAGTAALSADLSEVVVTIPIDGQATFDYEVLVTIPPGPGTLVPVSTLATLSGDLVLTGTFKIAKVPIAPIVGGAVALALLMSGALHAARAGR